MILRREKGREGQRQTVIRERNIDESPLVHATNRDRTHNLALSLDQESNLLSFGIWDDIPFSWATEADKDMIILNTYSFLLHEKNSLSYNHYL